MKKEQYIWYHDIKWDKAKNFELFLSDGRKVNFKTDVIENLQGFINKLERSL